MEEPQIWFVAPIGGNRVESDGYWRENGSYFQAISGYSSLFQDKYFIF